MGQPKESISQKAWYRCDWIDDVIIAIKKIYRYICKSYGLEKKELSLWNIYNKTWTRGTRNGKLYEKTFYIPAMRHLRLNVEK